MSGPMKPTKAEISAMFRNEQRDKEHLGFTLACQSLLTEADGPLGIRDFAIRLHHRNTEDMYPVLSAFDGYKDDTLHAIRDAERRWWASGFGGLVLEVLHAAVVSSAVVVTGRIAGRPDKLVVLDPVQLSNGRLDVDKGSLAVDEGGVVEVFNRLCVAASAKPVPFGPFPGSVPAMRSLRRNCRRRLLAGLGRGVTRLWRWRGRCAAICRGFPSTQCR